MITIQSNGTIKTILVNKKLGAKTKKPQVVICYDLLEGVTYAMEDLIFETKLEFLSIGIITISNETISLLSVGVSKIRIK